VTIYSGGNDTVYLDISGKIKSLTLACPKRQQHFAGIAVCGNVPKTAASSEAHAVLSCGTRRGAHPLFLDLQGKTVYSRSGKNLPPHRSRKIFNRDSVATLHAQGLSIGPLPPGWGWKVGTAARTLQERSKGLQRVWNRLANEVSFYCASLRIRPHAER
jgi:hypothetical protein